MTSFTPAQLFNCCTDHAEPDWARFDALELGGCVDLFKGEPEADGTCIQGGEPRASAEFFCIYGHIPGEGVEAITDVDTFAEAEVILAALVARSGLRGLVEC